MKENHARLTQALRNLGVLPRRARAAESTMPTKLFADAVRTALIEGLVGDEYVGIEFANELIKPMGFAIRESLHIPAELAVMYSDDEDGRYVGTVADGLELTMREILAEIDELIEPSDPDGVR